MFGALFPLVRASLRTGGHRLFAGLVPVFSTTVLTLSHPLQDSLTCRSGGGPSCAFRFYSEARQLLGCFARPAFYVVGHPCSVARRAFTGAEIRMSSDVGLMFA